MSQISDSALEPIDSANVKKPKKKKRVKMTLQFELQDFRNVAANVKQYSPLMYIERSWQ